MKTNGHDAETWIPLEAAAAQTGRSVPTINRLIRQGKVAKKLVQRDGKRPEPYVSLPDLERVLGESTLVPAIVRSAIAEYAVGDQIDPIRSDHGKGDDPINPITTILDRLAEIFARPQVELQQKLTWSLAEARTMTGLSEPALRAMLERNPDLAIRHAGRVRLKAGGLRKELS
jgi:hypothetical protein